MEQGIFRPQVQVLIVAKGIFAVTILDLMRHAGDPMQLEKGANKTTTTLNRGTAALATLAVGAEPVELLLHLPLMCEDKKVPCIFAKTKIDLGRACGFTSKGGFARLVSAQPVGPKEGSHLGVHIQELHAQIALDTAALGTTLPRAATDLLTTSHLGERTAVSRRTDPGQLDTGGASSFSAGA